VKPVDEALSIQLTLVLHGPRDAELKQLAFDVANPQSPLWRRFLTFDEWKARFAPSDDNLNAVSAWAESAGMMVARRSRSNRLLVVNTDVGTANRVFAAQLSEYSFGRRRFYANDRSLTVPDAVLPLLDDVLGIETLTKLYAANGQTAPDAPAPLAPAGCIGITRSARFAAPAARQPGANKPCILGPNPEYLEPPDLWASDGYDVGPLFSLSHCCNPTNNPGGSPANTSLVIVTPGFVATSDLTGFSTAYGLAGNVWEESVMDFSSPSYDTESAMDVEWAMAMANSFGTPDSTAYIHVYAAGYWPSTNLSAWDDAFSDGTARVFSTSIGGVEAAYESLLNGVGGLLGEGGAWISQYEFESEAATAMGWTLVAAAGDYGPAGSIPVPGVDSTACNVIGVQYPASDPFFIGVGGTNLNLAPESAFYHSENVWGTGFNNICPATGGGGGGCSAVTEQLPWQVPTYVTNYQALNDQCAAKGNSLGVPRLVPDISLNAGVGEAILLGGEWQSAEGTSIGAPELAALFVQANSYLAWLGLQGDVCGPQHDMACTTVGMAGPAVYAAASDAPHNPYYDILTGYNGAFNNLVGTQTTGYSAGPGFDLASGWGTVNAFQLAWAINNYVAPTSASFNFAFSSNPKPGRHVYTTDETVSFSVTGPELGVAGYTTSWARDPGDPTTEATPGHGNPFYSGPLNYGATGSVSLSSGGGGCNNLYVRAWDHTGRSAVTEMGPLCYLSCGGVLPDTTPVDGSCVPCGGNGEPCCTTGKVCASAADVCSEGSCVACGGTTEPCCTTGEACASTSDVCSDGRCVGCGASGELCCPSGSACAATTDVCYRGYCCLPGTCNPGQMCGTWSDDCGGTLDCGGCPEGDRCVATGNCLGGDVCCPSGLVWDCAYGQCMISNVCNTEACMCEASGGYWNGHTCE
jgi:xanthomonalisin